MAKKSKKAESLWRLAYSALPELNREISAYNRRPTEARGERILESLSILSDYIPLPDIAKALDVSPQELARSFPDLFPEESPPTREAWELLEATRDAYEEWKREARPGAHLPEEIAEALTDLADEVPPDWIVEQTTIPRQTVTRHVPRPVAPPPPPPPPEMTLEPELSLEDEVEDLFDVWTPEQIKADLDFTRQDTEMFQFRYGSALVTQEGLVLELEPMMPVVEGNMDAIIQVSGSALEDLYRKTYGDEERRVYVRVTVVSYKETTGADGQVTIDLVPQKFHFSSKVMNLWQHLSITDVMDLVLDDLADKLKKYGGMYSHLAVTQVAVVSVPIADLPTGRG